jgi:hypothetical protein
MPEIGGGTKCENQIEKWFINAFKKLVESWLNKMATKPKPESKTDAFQKPPLTPIPGGDTLGKPGHLSGDS